MSADVFVMVLGAALVHATWNALIKINGDRLAHPDRPGQGGGPGADPVHHDVVPVTVVALRVVAEQQVGAFLGSVVGDATHEAAG